MLETPETPTYLGLSGAEWHALGYGLLEGFKVWKRTPPMKPEEIDALPLSTEWKNDIKAKYHYYYIGFEAPEFVLLVLCLGYLVVTGQAGGLIKLALSYTGIVI
jgi:hypothetical protein